MGVLFGVRKGIPLRTDFQRLMSGFMCVTARRLRVRVVRVCMRTSLLCGCPLSVYRKINRGYFGAGARGSPRRRGRGYPPSRPLASATLMRCCVICRPRALWRALLLRVSVHIGADKSACVPALAFLCGYCRSLSLALFRFFDWGIFFAVERGGGKPRRVVVLFCTGGGVFNTARRSVHTSEHVSARA